MSKDKESETTKKEGTFGVKLDQEEVVGSRMVVSPESETTKKEGPFGVKLEQEGVVGSRMMVSPQSETTKKEGPFGVKLEQEGVVGSRMMVSPQSETTKKEGPFSVKLEQEGVVGSRMVVSPESETTKKEGPFGVKLEQEEAGGSRMVLSQESETIRKEDPFRVKLDQEEAAGSRMVLSPESETTKTEGQLRVKLEQEEVLDRSRMFDDTLEISEGVVLPVRRVMQPDNAQDTFMCFKCDFCDYDNPYGSQIEQHLQTAQHFSASSYHLYFQDGQVYPTAVEKQLVFTNPEVKHVKEVAVCVKCSDVFEDIFTCASHSKYSHNYPGRGCYALCPVVFEEKVICRKEPKCKHCRFTAQKHSALHSHWYREKHQPYIIPEANTMMICMCPYCDKFFSSNFTMAKLHVLDVHRKGVVRVRHIRLPQEAIEMPREHTVGCTVDPLRFLKENRYEMRTRVAKVPKSKIKK